MQFQMHCSTNQDHIHLDRTAVGHYSKEETVHEQHAGDDMWVCMYVHMLLCKFCACMSRMQFMLEFKICSNFY